jgi:hypothetical protein
MPESNGLFVDEGSVGKHSFSFIAGFHLGFPLAILHVKGAAAGWLEIRNLLSNAFRKNPKDFHLISLDYDPETAFPLGKPLILQYEGFLESIGFAYDLEALGVPVKSGKYKFDHLVWICPSGVVLLIWRISTDDEKLYRELRSVMYDDNQYDPSKHYYVSLRYVDLANIFIQIAQIVRGAVSPNRLSIISETSSSVDDFQKACSLLGEIIRPNVSETSQLNLFLSDTIKKKERNARLLFEELLIDVYYLEVNQCTKDGEFRIGYMESILNTKDHQYSLTTAVIFSSFVGFLWLRGYLTEELQKLQQILASSKAVSSELLFRLRLFRIFCTQLINESSPISINLMYVYMSRIEQFCRESRVDELVGQIQGQLETLEGISNGIEELNKEIRNFKIGIAAVLLSLVSITAVVAQLISTLDINMQLRIKERTFLILLGFIIGIFATIVIYALPDFRHSKK